MKIMKNVTAMFLAVVMVFSSAVVFAEEITAENADESVTLFSESVVNRDDGVWLFPMGKEHYYHFSDAAGCPGTGSCPFDGIKHNYNQCSSHTWQSPENNKFGHNGIDIAPSYGDAAPIYAAASGWCYLAGSESDARGLYVVIEHPIEGTAYSYYSYYQHLSSFGNYKNGEYVNITCDDEKKGIIGYCGKSGGYDYGWHLHFGIVIGNSGYYKNVLNDCEKKPWLVSPGIQLGQIVTNPSLSSPAGLPNVWSFSSLSRLIDHCGSVRYTFDKNEVSIGENGNYKPLAPVTVPAGTYSIRTLCNTSKALDVNSGVADTYIWDENSNDSQKWKIEPVGSYYKIINVQTGLALDVKGGKAESGTQVQQYQYNGTAAQMWQFLDAGNGNVYIRSALGCYLDLYGANTNNGNNLYVYNLNEEGGRINQTWQLKTISLAPVVTYSTMTTGDYSITCGSSYLTAASDVNNSAVKGTSSNGSTNQQFTIKPCGSSYYIESKSSSSGRVVNVNTSTHSANGNGVTVYYKTADGSQTWLFEKKGDKYIIHPTDNTSLALTLNSNGSVSVTNSTGASNQLWSVTNLVMCTVSFDANGGSGAPASITAPIDSTITISSQIPQRYGYDFLGWWIQGTEALWYPGTSMQAFEVTFLAYWSPKNKNYVTYNANGGSGGPSIQSKYEGETLTLSTERPTRAGYTFQGWSTSSTGGVQYSPGSTYSDNADVTLYAVWQANKPGKPVITASAYHVYNGVAVDFNWNAVEYADCYEFLVRNADTNAAVIWTRVSQTFYNGVIMNPGTYYVYAVGVNSNLIDTGDIYFTYSDPITVIWEDKYYTISYDANGGENAPAAQTKRHNQSITITSEIPTRAGYKFKGWAGNPQGEVELVPGQVCDYNYSWTFYAVWQLNAVPVTSLALNKEASHLAVGDTLTLTASISPSEATNPTVTWTSSNTDVATVEDGVVTGIKAGTVTVTASADGITASCSVTVVEDYQQSGSLYWIIENGTLIVFGNGDMSDYSLSGDNVAPWSKSSFSSVVIEGGVTSVGYAAFYNCKNLTSATIPDGVTSIGGWAFYNCGSLMSVNIPESVTSIADYSFDGCKSLTSVTIPSSVKSVGHSAFYGCSSLTSVTIPEGVTSIGSSAFCDCSRLTSIIVDENNTKYSNDERGVLFNKGKTTLLQYPIGNTAISYAIPDSVTSIEDSSFRGCSSLESITIPESVTSIDSYAFKYCSALKSVEIPSRVNSISANVFEECRSLTSVIIPKSVTSIGDDAFYNCVSLTSIEIPSNVTQIGYSAFEGCSSLVSVNIPANVTKINGDLFNGCSSLTNVTIPENVTRIGWHAFSGCSSLSSVKIPSNVTIIDGKAFSRCSSLTSVTIASGVTSIGFAAFSECSSLMSVTIPSSVTSIGEYAFSDCSSLASVTIPDSVTSVGSWAFKNCSSLSSITADENNQNYSSDERGVLFNKDKTQLIQYPIGNTATSYNIPKGVTSIGEEAFSGCRKLTSVTIPSSVTSIGGKAFYNCISLKDVYYPGTKEEWSAITIGPSNSRLTSATIHYNTVPAESLTLDKDIATLAVGDTLTLTATVSPTEGTNPNVTWTSSNPDIATVENGVVTAKAVGAVTITATADFGGCTAICEVTVILLPDVTGDGSVDAADLRAYFASVCGADSVEVSVCDIDGDGTVGLKDLRILARMLDDSWGM